MIEKGAAGKPAEGRCLLMKDEEDFFAHIEALMSERGFVLLETCSCPNLQPA
ncbi:MAG TPA: hypothetical protein PLX50_06015 [Candidatus Aminicenantes bacterium]|nr:hypothetical protein [Candidatus Aminicenantes bacterium]